MARATLGGHPPRSPLRFLVPHVQPLRLLRFRAAIGMTKNRLGATASKRATVRQTNG
jgi:hypothetical protein